MDTPDHDKDPPPQQRRAARRVGRPTKVSAADIDDRILAAAWELFVARSYGAVTMDAVAERAGVTRATIYLRHSSKVGLLRATIAAKAKHWSQMAAQSDWMLGETLEERLTRFGCMALRWGADDEIAATRRMVDVTSVEGIEAARELDMTIREPTVALLASKIAEFAPSEGVRPSDPRQLALLYMGMLEAVWRSAPDADPSVHCENVPKVVAILMRGKAAW